MKFPRNARILRSHFDVAPFAAVIILLVLFLALGTLLPIPGIGVSLEVPTATDLPGSDKPSVAVAVDASGRLFFANQMVTESQLTNGLSQAVRSTSTPLRLVIHADKAVTYDQLLHLTLLARDAGIHDALLATLPHVVEGPVIQP
jgi:biopolymer transport protein ExbD